MKLLILTVGLNNYRKYSAKHGFIVFQQSMLKLDLFRKSKRNAFFVRQYIYIYIFVILLFNQKIKEFE